MVFLLLWVFVVVYGGFMLGDVGGCIFVGEFFVGWIGSYVLKLEVVGINIIFNYFMVLEVRFFDWGKFLWKRVV